jgi:hypothetical protein
MRRNDADPRPPFQARIRGNRASKGRFDRKSSALATATKRETAGQCLVGPATSRIDLPFLDACFADGLFDVFGAISIHLPTGRA